MEFLKMISAAVTGGFTPGIAFQNLRVAVNTAIGQQVDIFDVWADPRNETIDLFAVVSGEKRKYPFADTRLMPLIKWGISKYLKNDSEIHMIILRVTPGLVLAEVYFEDENGAKDCVKKEFNV